MTASQTTFSATPQPVSFAAMKTRADVASCLLIDDAFLRYILYGARERKRYRRFSIPKRGGGSRHISAPPKNLAILQRKLASIFIDIHQPKPSAHGFLKGRSIASNARCHVQQRHVFNLDLKNFFPNIHIGRFIALLQHKPFLLTQQAATVVAQICFDDTGVLPQGGPSSPIVSNILARSLDVQNQRLAQRFRCVYSRYADDLTFSTSQHRFPEAIAVLNSETREVTIGKPLLDNLKSAGFKPNYRKVRLQSAPDRREVTGLTVNEIPNVTRSYVRELDSIIQSWEKYGAASAAQHYCQIRGMTLPVSDVTKHLKDVLIGKIGFLQMVKGVDDPVVRRLKWKIADIFNDPEKAPPPLKLVKSSALRGLTGKFAGWQHILRSYMNSVLYTSIVSTGHAATAFVISPNTLASAGHVAEQPELRVGFDPHTYSPDRRSAINVDGSLDIGLLHFSGTPFSAATPLPFQYRLPQIGEEVAAIGYPRVPSRDTTLVMHTGTVEALPVGYHGDVFIQTSFPSGGGLSGSPLVDKRGFVLGVMVENVFMAGDGVAPQRPYGQAIPFEYVARLRTSQTRASSVLAMSSSA